MSFANSLKKGHYFLNFEDEKQRVIKLTYAKGSDGDQKVWSWNKSKNKVREVKSPNCFTIVH